MLVVQKFGGTSLGTIELIKNAANIIAERYEAGDKLVVVVSAMAGITNSLIGLSSDLSSLNNQEKLSEYDSVLSTGETVSASLLALALQEINIPARSMQAWQVKISTDNQATKALIQDIETKPIYCLMDQGIIPIVTGFQGINQHNKTITLGRGGSDTTAVAIAAALGAKYCEIYTDVVGVYSADPRLIHNALLVSQLSYEEMLELAGIGAKVLHPRAVEVGMRYSIPIKIISSFSKVSGTLIMNKPINEINRITGITYLRHLTRVHISSLEISLTRLITAFVHDHLTPHQILKASDEEIVFTVLEDHYVTLNNFLTKFHKSYFKSYHLEKELSCVAIIGAAIRHNINILAAVLNTLSDANIKILHMFNTEIKLSLIVNEHETERAVKLLHQNLILPLC